MDIFFMVIIIVVIVVLIAVWCLHTSVRVWLQGSMSSAVGSRRRRCVVTGRHGYHTAWRGTVVISSATNRCSWQHSAHHRWGRRANQCVPGCCVMHDETLLLFIITFVVHPYVCNVYIHACMCVCVYVYMYVCVCFVVCLCLRSSICVFLCVLSIWFKSTKRLHNYAHTSRFVGAFVWLRFVVSCQ